MLPFLSKLVEKEILLFSVSNSNAISLLLCLWIETDWIWLQDVVWVTGINGCSSGVRLDFYTEKERWIQVYKKGRFFLSGSLIAPWSLSLYIQTVQWNTTPGNRQAFRVNSITGGRNLCKMVLGWSTFTSWYPTGYIRFMGKCAYWGILY